MGLPLGFDEVYPNTKQPLNQNHSEDNTHLDFPDTDVIIILSRKSNRLILNEQQLAIDLTKKYGLETKFVSNEDHSFEEQIKIIRRARIVVGMHGSILVMSMFTRRGTVFIEMFPFGVPSKHYTPYKTMSNLPGMDLVYRSWENIHEELSVGYPDRHKLNGGLNDLSAEERQLVLDTKDVPQHICCASPYWLYRIYQDTTVTIHEIISLIDDALEESRMIVLPRVYNTNLFLGNIDVGTVLQIDCVKDPSNLKGTLYARWEDLWNKEVDFWEVLINNDGKIYKTTREPSFILGGFADGDLIVFFVRAVSDGKRADWGTAGQCIV
jgi:protein O-mannose beta-1,4-N-acetylglucosaminyltransferase